MSDSQKEKETLIEMFGVNFQTHHHLSPLASRILGTLIIDGCKAGITFEELVERTGASKSSISSNLNLLLKTKYITYYTIAGDRKKYFKTPPLSQRLLNYIGMLNSENEIIELMIAYRKKTISCTAEQCNLEIAIAYKEHILEAERLIKKTIEQFKAIETIIDENK